MSGTIQVMLNGEPLEVSLGCTLAELLSQKGIHTLTGLACERNGEILAPAKAASCVLEQGDDILLVRIVGGG